MTNDKERAEFVQALLLKEIEYRRELRWRIFSWASTLLTAITGGLVAAKLVHSCPAFSWKCNCVMTIAIVVLGSLAAYWLYLNEKRERQLAKAWENQPGCQKSPLKNCGASRAEIRLGKFNVIGIVILTIAAVVSVFFPFQ